MKEVLKKLVIFSVLAGALVGNEASALSLSKMLVPAFNGFVTKLESFYTAGQAFYAKKVARKVEEKPFEKQGKGAGALAPQSVSSPATSFSFCVSASKSIHGFIERVIAILSSCSNCKERPLTHKARVTPAENPAEQSVFTKFVKKNKE
ncbi:MAG: hypothetical protein M1549_03635 [Candidatus Dependentiae bacterium]|nr:hypothetical protein [Candidatus Dependentiae bacterium]